MNMLSFIFKKAFSSLKYLGVTSLIISLAVFFSAFSAMAMITLANQFYNAAVGDSRVALGGDASISIPELSEEKSNKLFSLLDSLKDQKIINEYSVSKSTFGIMLKKPGQTGLVMSRAITLYDEKYPLVGEIKLENGKGIKESITEDAIVISKDLAEKLNVSVGDTVSLVSFDLVNSINLKIASVVSSDSNNRGGFIFTNDKQLKSVSSYSLGKSISLIGDEKKIEESLSGFSLDDGLDLEVKTLSEHNEENGRSMAAFTSFFRGLSILGLFIGSLGIASSMQVLISRRKREIGIMKAIGFQKSQIIFSFILELVIISLPGILVGIVGGYFFSGYLTDIVEKMGANFSFNVSFDWSTALLVFGVSLFSAIIFAFQSVEKYASLMPIVVLRENSGDENGKISFFKSAFIYLIVGGLFTGLSILITQDVKFGLIFVGVAAGGTFLASIIFRLLFWLILRIPVRTKNFIELSWLNLRKSYKKMMLSTVAIFVGVVSITLILCLVEATRKEVSTELIEVKSTINVVSVTDGKDDSFSKALQEDSSVDWFIKTYQYPLGSESMVTALVARESLSDAKDIVVIEGSLEDGLSALAPSVYNGLVSIGTIIPVKTAKGDYMVKISGFYEPKEKISVLSSYISNGLIVSNSTFFEMVDSGYKEIDFISTVANQEVSFDAKFSKQFPNSIVLTNTSIQEYYNGTINMFVKMIVSIASLALLAGGILLLNTTSLEVITRRRSFGLLKVIGFNNRKVRWMLLAEYGFVFLITFGVSYLFSYIGVLLFNQFSEQIFGYKFNIDFLYGQTLLLMLGMAIFISALIFLISKKYLDTKPVDVLRYE